MSGQTLLSRFDDFFRRFTTFAQSGWYAPLIGVFAGIDLFILVIPTDVMLLSAAAARPRRWLSIALIVAIGSALGALGVAALIEWDVTALQHFFPRLFESTQWKGTEHFLAQYGHWALAAIAASPLPYQPAVVLSALSSVPLPVVFFSTVAGRAAKYLLFAWLASHAPQLLVRWWRPTALDSSGVARRAKPD